MILVFPLEAAFEFPLVAPLEPPLVAGLPLTTGLLMIGCVFSLSVDLFRCVRGDAGLVLANVETVISEELE